MLPSCDDLACFLSHVNTQIKNLGFEGAWEIIIHITHFIGKEV